MEVVLITGTMGAGKTKYIIDRYLNGELLKEYRAGEVGIFEHCCKTIYDGYIKSRAYDGGTFLCTMADDRTDFRKNGKKYVIIDESQAFEPETIERIITELKEAGVRLLIFSMLKYYANGNIWQSYEVVEKTCKKLGIGFEEKVQFYSKCNYPGCNEYAIKHKLKPENELKLQQGLFDFGMAGLSEYEFFCEKCFAKVQNEANNATFYKVQVSEVK
ncbi:hypothetical protein FACS1894152_4580 [Bacilli bacterium]|nr:hypothetical protein FACS1894152_4580 [Bacilli bacterium]